MYFYAPCHTYTAAGFKERVYIANQTNQSAMTVLPHQIDSSCVKMEVYHMVI